MRKIPNLKFSPPRTNILAVRGWPRGLNTLVNPNSIRIDELAEAVNVAYAQYGVLTKRLGTSLVVNLGGPVQGFGTYNHRADDGTVTTYFCAVAGGKLYTIDPINKTKTEITGKTFHPTNRVVLKQGMNYLYIFDGASPLVYWDGTSFHTFTRINPPASVTLTKTGTGTGTTTYSYIVTASNEVDETNGSPAAQMANMPAKLDTNTYITVSWPAVAGAVMYNIYKGTPGNEKYLTSTPATSFIDQGQADAAQSMLIVPPTQNNTAGPVFATGTVYHDAIVGVDITDRTKIWYSAGGDKINSFSYGDGGGWYRYHAEEGEPVNGLEIFAGLGRDYLYIFKDHKIGQMAFGVSGEVQVSDVNLAIGAASDASVFLFENDLGFWSQYGAYTLRMEPNLVNVLRVAELTIRVHPTYVNSITRSALRKVCGIYDKANHVMLWSIPNGASENNTSLAYDPIYLGFSEYRGIAATAFGRFVDAQNNEYTYGGDKNGNVFRLFDGSSDMGNPIYFRAATKVFDMDAPFSYKYFQRLFLFFGNVNAQNLKVTCIQDGLALLKEFSVASGSGQTGWDMDFWDGQFWDASSGNIISINNRSVLKYLDINKDLFSVQVIYENTSPTDNFEILSMFILWRASNKPLPSSMRVS